MALTRLYFDSSGNALADGTSWTNRAPLLSSSGTWSPYIRNFNFAGSDTLECYVGPATYDVLEAFSSSIFSNAPTYQNTVYFTACDSSGNEWVPPDSGWVSAEPVWSTGNMPIIKPSGNTISINLTYSQWRGFNIQTSTRSGGSLFTGNCQWCVMTNSATGTSAGVVGNGTSPICHDSVFKSEGNSYEACAIGQNFSNCRFEGNASASAGTRYGLASSANSVIIADNCTAINHLGFGIGSTSSAIGVRLEIDNCVIDNCSSGVYTIGSHTTVASTIANTMITDCDSGIIIAGSGRAIISDVRLRDNVANIVGNGNYPAYNLITSSGTDAAEYVNTATGDYRIKSTSSLWGNNIGAGDESISASGGGSTTIICRR